MIRFKTVAPGDAAHPPAEAKSVEAKPAKPAPAAVVADEAAASEDAPAQTPPPAKGKGLTRKTPMKAKKAEKAETARLFEG